MQVDNWQLTLQFLLDHRYAEIGINLESNVQGCFPVLYSLLQQKNTLGCFNLIFRALGWATCPYIG